MRKTERFTVLLLALLTPLGGTGLAGGGRPVAKVLSVVPGGGELVNVTLLVRDRRSRPLDLRIEYRVKGLKGWFPATVDRDLTGVPSSPKGTEFAFRWLAYEDLGCSYRKKARVRATVLSPPGRRKRSRKLELHLYREPAGTDLRADLLADLVPDGVLDSLVLIDTRAPEHFRTGAVPGAISLQLEEIEERGKAALPWPEDTRIVFYCYGGT